MIIVTGGAGFIGSSIVAALNNRNITNILVVDELGTNQKWKNLCNLSFTDYVEKGDFLDMIIENKLNGSVEAVFHLGACSDTTETNASYLIKNNYEYSKLLAQWATSDSIRFIYASSAATYGEAEAGFSDDLEKLETLRPLNIYGYSKHLFDLWAYKTRLLKNIVGLKYFNVFGPNEYHKADMRSFVIKAFEQIKTNGVVRLFKSYRPEYPDGQQLRDFIYVKDAVEMTLFFYDNPKIGGLFNIGTGRARSWNDLVKAVFSSMGKETKIEYIEMPESMRDHYQYYTEADMTSLRKAGFDKQTSGLEEAIKDYVQNYLQKNRYLNGIKK